MIVMPRPPDPAPMFSQLNPGQKPQAKASQPTFISSALESRGQQRSLIGGAPTAVGA